MYLLLNNFNRTLFLIFSIILFYFIITNVHAEQTSKSEKSNSLDKKYPDTFKIQVGTYFISDSDTGVFANGSVAGIGTSIEFERDLGTEQKATVPRVDGYYRFNESHRIEFAWFSIDRDGLRTIDINIDFKDEPFIANETIASALETDFYKIAYGYSFAIEFAVPVTNESA